MDVGNDRIFAAINLQQTLIAMTPLILTALAVAFAFRCGMFNIGGQGQYIVGLVCSLWVGLHFAGMAKPLHIFLALLAAIARRRRSGPGSPARSRRRWARTR